MANLKFIKNNQVVTTQEAESAPILVAVGEEQEVRLFSQESELESWARTSKHAEIIQKGIESVRKAKNFGAADEVAISNRQKAIVNRITEDLKKLSAETNLPTGSKELFQKAAVD